MGEKQDPTYKFTYWVPYILCYVSGFCLMTVAILMLRNKRLSKYPYTLVAWLCLQESFLFFNFGARILMQDEIYEFLRKIWKLIVFVPFLDEVFDHDIHYYLYARKCF